MGDSEVPAGCAGIYRRPGTVDVSSYEHSFMQFVEAESIDVFAGALEAIGVRWVSAPSALARAELKLLQIEMASRLHLPIPRTIVTNDRHEATAFALAAGAVIVKPVRYGLLSVAPDPLVAWTSEVTAADLEDLSGPPIVIQERVKASRHLRVVTVGTEVFVAALDDVSVVDWRRDLENHQRFRPVDYDDLPEVRSGARQIALEFHLGYTAQDWIISDREEAVFLELNPNGQWSFLDERFGGRITRALARRLVKLASTND